ncbi:MAG TPA: hypothetical protein VMG60_02660 [Burkholderiaceae bacterium]|nr:hypothetical protein [Burkholderiaceae bacterium]
MPGADAIATAVPALIFAAVFLLGRRLYPLQAFGFDRRSLVSFGAGMATAYVFVHVMPELQGARRALVESASRPLRYEGMAVYVVALLGFMGFYALDHLRTRLRMSAAPDRDRASFRLHVGGFAAYVALVGYLLVRNLEETPVSIGLYTAAMAFHFVGVDHSLNEEHGQRYDTTGRYVLAAMALAGWAIGQLTALSQAWVALLLAFLSGAVILNSSLMELPSDKDGRLWPFLIGGLLYASILLPLG